MLPQSRRSIADVSRGAGVRYQFTVLHVLVAPVALAAVMMVAGCSPAAKSVADNRHMQPLSEGMLAELKNKKMEEGSPILMRIFKEESELEVWKWDESGRFALLRTYPI